MDTVGRWRTPKRHVDPLTSCVKWWRHFRWRKLRTGRYPPMDGGRGKEGKHQSAAESSGNGATFVGANLAFPNNLTPP
jgi:hypothetical protein